MITLITKAQADLVRQSGHNSPADIKGTKWKPFSHEFSEIRDALASLLATKYRLGRGPNVDLFFDSDILSTRVLYLEVVSLAAVTPAFITLLSSFLSSRPEDYRIAACEADGFLRATDGSLYPRFYLALTKTATLLYAESRETLTRFGVSPPSKEPNSESSVSQQPTQDSG